MSNANEPAYPLTEQGGEPGQRLGLTKREYFAAMAMQGILRDPNIAEANRANISRISVEFADALLDELERTA